MHVKDRKLATSAISTLYLALAASLATASPYTDAVLDDSPVAYYPFEESGGATAADVSGNNYDGVYTGALGFGAASGAINLGNAIDFTGGYVALPVLGTFAESTVEMWFQLDAHNPGACCTGILTSDTWAAGALHLNMTPGTNLIQHTLNSGAPDSVFTTAGITSGTWYHLVTTHSNTLNETKTYLNGIEVADDGDHTTLDVIFGIGGMRLGGWAGDGLRIFDGRIDELAVYDSVLSPARVQAHYAAASDPGTPKVVSFTASNGSVTSDVGVTVPSGGGLVTLAWNVEDVVSVEIDNGALASTPNASGSVDVNVAVDTTFILTATNAAGPTMASVEILVAPVPLDPRLTEFMAENDGSLLDGNGASSDWIEIYNPNAFPIDLAGYQLLDGVNTWTFPSDSIIPALGYLVVFASGNDAADPAGSLHANFSLSNAGEYLALRRSDGSVIDEFSPAFPEQFADTSYGSGGYFPEPTPGAENGSSFDHLLDKTDDTTFAFGRGFYPATFDETITALTPGASIIYTLDGTLPSETNGTRVDAVDSSTPPSATVQIDGSADTGVTTLRAIVFKAGSLPTNVDTQTYVFSSLVPSQSSASAIANGWPTAPVNSQVFDFGMNLNNIAPGSGNYTAGEITTSLESIPTLSLVTDFDNLIGAASGIYVNALNRGRNWERPVSVELIYPNGYADPDGNTDGFQIDAGLRIRGGHSRNPQFLKHGFRLFFRGEYGDTKLNYPLFGTEGADEFDNVDLRSSSNFDWAREADFNTGNQFTFTRDVFSRDTQGALGQAYTKSRYYHLYLNGTYWGIYQTEERPNKSFGESYFGGNSDDYDTVKCSNHVGGFVTEATDGTLDVFEDLWNKVRDIGLNDPSDAKFFALEGRGPDGVRDPNLPVLLDVDNLIDEMLLIFWTGNGDGVLSSFLGNNRPNNWFGIRNRNGEEGFRFFAHDCEFTLGSSNTQVDRTGPFTGSNQNSFLYANPQWMHQDLMANAEYRLRFADRVQKHFFNDGALTEAACIARFNRRTDQVRPALRAYAARWGDARYAPSYNTGLWETEIAWITNSWMPGRTAVVLQQLRDDNLYPDIGAPLFEDGSGSPQAGGEVANGFQLHLTDPNVATPGTIYYTLDGSDPRVEGLPTPTVTTTILDYTDARSYHVPVSATDGFLSDPALSATPLAYYPFDADASDAATANGAQDGTFFNGASISPNGRIGSGALLLDGTDDYVGLGDPTELQITGQISMAAWVKANALPSGALNNILGKGHWLSPNSEIYLRHAGQIDGWRVASWDGTIHGTEVTGASADLGQWVHLVGTYDGTNWNLFRNGVLAASTPESTGALAVPNDWAIGARGTGTERFFNGFIDEVYFFDTALSAQDVTKLYTGSAPEWHLPGYADAATWQSGAGGHGYDDPGGTLLPLIGTDVATAMKNVSASLLTRADFTIGSGALDGIDYLEMNISYDGGYVAYLNGTEVHRANAPADLNGESEATASHSPADEIVTINLTEFLPLLQEGSNLLAVHSLNDSIGSSDHLIRYQLRVGQIPASITPTAIEYTGPITINGPTTVNARVFRNGEWSPLNTAVFHTGAVPGDDQNLVISQIHYNPSAEIGDTYSAKNYEFLEILNIGTQRLTLDDLHIRDEVSFDFPADTFLEPGERAQIVANSQAFAERYSGHPVRVLGQYGGSLANEGGRLHLFGDTGGTIRDFSYDDVPLWPTAADGDGYGLVLIQPESNPDHADPLNWRRSTAIHAQPGASDAVEFSGDPDADLDEDGNSAFLEYATGTNDSVPNPALWSVSSNPFEVSISRRVNADDTLWIVETSEDLITWSDDPAQYLHESAAGNESWQTVETYRVASSGSADRKFIRVRIVQQ